MPTYEQEIEFTRLVGHPVLVALARGFEKRTYRVQARNIGEAEDKLERAITMDGIGLYGAGSIKQVKKGE